MYKHVHGGRHATLFLSHRCNGKYLAFGRAVATSSLLDRPNRRPKRKALPNSTPLSIR